MKNLVALVATVALMGPPWPQPAAAAANPVPTGAAAIRAGRCEAIARLLAESSQTDVELADTLLKDAPASASAEVRVGREKSLGEVEYFRAMEKRFAGGKPASARTVSALENTPTGALRKKALACK